jgi:hypothetical protein
VGLERGTLSPVGTIEDQLERKSISSGLESREYGLKDPRRFTVDLLVQPRNSRPYVQISMIMVL